MKHPLLREYSRHDAPLVPRSLPRDDGGQATLTLLTGMHGGRIAVIDGPSITLGRDDDAGLVVDDCGVSGHHARIVRTPEGGYYVEDLESTNGTFLGAGRVRVAPLREGDVLQLGPTARLRFAIVDSGEMLLRRRIHESSLRDPLTRAFSREYLADRLLVEMSRARRTGGNLAVLMIDVDALKEVNDLCGHLAGDRALSAISEGILHSLRAEDLLARYGGDEFALLALGAGRVEALGLADRIRRVVTALRLSARGRRVHLTVSVGVASLPEVPSTDHGTALLACADQRLYAAKAAGKNRICAWNCALRG